MNEEFFDELILSGAVEVIGLDDNGDFFYAFSENLEEINPGLHEHINQEFHRSIMTLWEEGFLKMDVTEADPLITITDKAFNDEAISHLPKLVQMRLKGVMDAMRREP